MNTGAAHHLSLAATAAFMLFATSAARSDSIPRITQVHVIPSSGVVSRIEHFATTGQPAIITNVWSTEGKVYTVAMEFSGITVTVDRRTGKMLAVNDWNAIPLRDGQQSVDRILEDNVYYGFGQALMFAKALLDGRPATLLIRATNQNPQPYPSLAPAPIDFDVYELRQEPILDEDRFYFGKVAHWTTAEKHCNATFALKATFGIASLEPSDAGGTLDCEHWHPPG